MARAAHDAGAIVTADIDNIYEGLPELLPLIDVLITSSEFPHRLTGISDLRESLTEIKSRYGCAIVGATLGARGAWFTARENSSNHPRSLFPAAVATRPAPAMLFTRDSFTECCAVKMSKRA